jgi:hypothetical protein
MTFALVIRPEAERDLAETRDWYEEHRGGLGQEFLIAVEDVLGPFASPPNHMPLCIAEFDGRDFGDFPTSSIFESRTHRLRS